MFACNFEGKRYDVGEKLGFVKTTIEFELQNEEIKDDLVEFLEQTVKNISSEKINA